MKVSWEEMPQTKPAKPVHREGTVVQFFDRDEQGIYALIEEGTSLRLRPIDVLTVVPEESHA